MHLSRIEFLGRTATFAPYFMENKLVSVSVKFLSVALGTAILASFNSEFANAEHDLYVTSGVLRVDDENATLDGFVGRLGWHFSDHFGVEGEFAVSTGEDQQGFARVELADTYAAFVTARIEPVPELQLAVRTGLISTGVEVTAPEFSSSIEQNSAAVGGYAQWFLTEHLGLRAGYTYSKSDTFELSAIWKF